MPVVAPGNGTSCAPHNERPEGGGGCPLPPGLRDPDEAGPAKDLLLRATNSTAGATARLEVWAVAKVSFGRVSVEARVHKVGGEVLPDGST